LNPGLTTAYTLLGVTLRRQGDHAAALAEFRKAVAADPNDPRAQFNLGKELKAGGDLAGAIAAFQRAIDLKPDYEDAHYNLGIALRDQGFLIDTRRQENQTQIVVISNWDAGLKK
jgi:superkiller protein 3